MLNHITIMGRLVADPELRRANSGVAVTSFTIACDRDFGNNGEKETDFVEIVCWRNTAEFVSKYFSKGRMAVISAPALLLHFPLALHVADRSGCDHCLGCHSRVALGASL